MARNRPRRERRAGLHSREPVPAWPAAEDDPDEWPDGSAGVREPRHPKPIGPMSGAGAKPMPEVEFGAVLAETEPPVGACWV